MPIELGVMAHGSSQHPLFSQQPDLIYQVSSGSVVESVLFLEGNLLRLGPWLPDAMLFAAFRGFSWLLLFLAMPALLRRLGANRPMAWLGTFLCFLAPASLWWSFMPIRILAFAAAGCLLLFLARDRLVAGRRVTGLLLAGLAGLCLARLVTYYVPWSVTIGVPLVVATGLFLLREREGRRAALTAIATGAGVGLLLLVGTFWENWPALHAELNTVYPGQRRATGMAQAPYQLFGAPGLSELEDDPDPDAAEPERDQLGVRDLRGLGGAPLESRLAAARPAPAGRGRRPRRRHPDRCLVGDAVVGHPRRARAAAQRDAARACGADRRLPGDLAGGALALARRGALALPLVARRCRVRSHHGVRRERPAAGRCRRCAPTRCG